MVKPAIPIDGSHRAGHILNNAKALACIIASSLIGAGCGSDSGSDPTDVPASAGTSVLELVHDNQRWQTSALTWPRDVYEHPQAPVESREWFVLLVDDRDDSVHGVIQRLSRAALTEPSSVEETSGSAWAYDNAMQITGRWVTAQNTITHWSETERVAAGLSTMPESISAHNEERELNGRVLGHEISFLPDVSGFQDYCRGSWQLAHADGARVSIQQNECPIGSVARSTVSTRSGPLRANAVVTADGLERELSGVAWTRHVWGRAIAASGAVRYDTLLVTLAGLGTFEILATRRKSGRGRTVTTFSELNASSSSREQEANWYVMSDPDALLTRRSRLEIPSLKVDVEITPLGPVAADPDGRARHPVIATGSHQGAGYLDVAGEYP